MTTDWTLIRAMMNAAIDACERIEATGFTPEERDAMIEVRGQAVSVQDFLVSAWTLPENLRYRIIQARHDAGADLTYVPEAARILTSMAGAAAELIRAGQAVPTAEVLAAIAWYRDHAVPGVERAVAGRRAAD